MSLLSSAVSITRYKVEGAVEEPVIETIRDCLKRNEIVSTENDLSEKVVGWTSFDSPFDPKFDGSSFLIGTHLVFSIRIDKKTIPPKIIRKHCAIEEARRIAETGREYLSRSEKKSIKDHVMAVLISRIPSTPNVYDLIWDYEGASLWFFSNLKSANEELETLFSESFNLSLIRLFPYTIADLTAGLSAEQRDVLAGLSETNFKG